MEERGTTESEVKTVVSIGEKIPAKYGRTGFRLKFPFGSHRNDEFFRFKQVEVYGVDEGTDFVVITVVVKYF